MDGLLKQIIIRKDCVIFLSHGEDMKIEVLKPIPVTKFVKLLDKYFKQGYKYFNTGDYQQFIESSIKAHDEHDLIFHETGE